MKKEEENYRETKQIKMMVLSSIFRCFPIFLILRIYRLRPLFC
jgi:hypothetical protein